MRGLLAVLVAALASALAVGQAGRLEPVVEAWARRLATALRPVDVEVRPLEPVPGLEFNSDPSLAAPPSGLARPGGPPRTRQRGAPAPAGADAPSAVRISAATVLRFAKARAMPNAVPVAAEAQRPAGLRLFGVSRLGVGVLDGDVLTQVAGTPVTGVSAVVSTILTLRAQRAAGVDGTLWRGLQSYPIHVELPYPVATVGSSGAGPAAPATAP